MKVRITLLTLLSTTLLLMAGTTYAQKLTAQEVQKLSTEEKLRGAQRVEERISRSVSSTERLLEDIRNGDATAKQIQCVSEKLTTINGFSKVASQSSGRMDRSVDRGDTEGAAHHYMMMMIADQRVKTLEAQAQQCAGKTLEYAGRTQRSVAIEEMAPGYDSGAFDDNMAGAFFVLEEVPPPATAAR